MLAQHLESIRRQIPRIHCITNGVSAPLSANGLIAIGGAPIMADDPEEVAEVTACCQGLSLNLGMPNPRKLTAMLTAGAVANERGIPVVFDTVGVGVSQFRRVSAQTLLDALQFTAIRGNLSEMQVLAGGVGHCLGVDAGDRVTAENLPQVVDFARNFARETGAIVAISSAIDVVTDGETAYLIRNGHPMLSGLSGSGCLLSCLLTAYLAASEGTSLTAAVAALCTMGYCGQLAAHRCGGRGSFSVELLDALGNLQGKTLEMGANYEIYRG